VIIDNLALHKSQDMKKLIRDT